MGFPRQEYGVGCHFLLQGIFPDPGIKPRSPALQADSLLFEPLGKYGLLLANWGSHMALVVKNPPANAGDVRDASLIPRSGRSPGGGQGNPLHILAWRIPWTEEPGGLQSIGAQRVGHD